MPFRSAPSSALREAAARATRAEQLPLIRPRPGQFRQHRPKHGGRARNGKREHAEQYASGAGQYPGKRTRQRSCHAAAAGTHSCPGGQTRAAIQPERGGFKYLSTCGECGAKRGARAQLLPDVNGDLREVVQQTNLAAAGLRFSAISLAPASRVQFPQHRRTVQLLRRPGQSLPVRGRPHPSPQLPLQQGKRPRRRDDGARQPGTDRPGRNRRLSADDRQPKPRRYSARANRDRAGQPTRRRSTATRAD